jgi:hypothetical protein
MLPSFSVSVLERFFSFCILSTVRTFTAKYVKYSTYHSNASFFFFGGTGVCIQGLTFARQACYHLSYSAIPLCVCVCVCFGYFDVKSSVAFLIPTCCWLSPSSDLLKEQTLRKKAELESAQCRLQLQVLTDECTKLHSRVQVSLSFLIQRTFGITIKKEDDLRGI